MKSFLILEDGTSFSGERFGAETTATGELAIQTGNHGYQEALTDPTNAGKILVFTTPIIGTSGINAINYEAINPKVRGIIANDIAWQITTHENFQDLGRFLEEKRVPAIWGVDTRALVHKLAQKNVIKASIMDTDDQHAFDQIKALVLPKNKTSQVSTGSAYAAPNIGQTVAIIDLGLKHSLLRALSLRKINCLVMPYDTTVQDIYDLRPDGLILSNGPGSVSEVKTALTAILKTFYGKIPIMGIGLGFLILSDYLNFKLTPLNPPFNGNNYPVIETKTSQIWQTAMNIQKLVSGPDLTDDLTQTYFELHTHLLAGFTSQENKLIATAFNPEGSPGSFAARGIYDQFLKMMEMSR